MIKKDKIIELRIEEDDDVKVERTEPENDQVEKT